MRLACLPLLASCAHASFEPRIEPVGEPASGEGLGEQAVLLPSGSLRSVRVAEGRLPDGLSFEGGQLSVTDPSRYELLAQVSAAYEPTPALLSSFSVGFYRYGAGEAWKNAYCNAQVPLGWLTLGLWSAVPVHYPCVVTEEETPQAASGRRARILEALVRGTVASGGNLLVVTDLADARSAPVLSGAGVAVLDKTLPQ